MSDKTNNHGMNRRGFLKHSTLGILGAGALAGTPGLGAENPPKPPDAPTPPQTPEMPRIKAHRKLGRTQFMASDLGTGGIPQPGVLRAVLDAGINYIDTAESYGNGQSEKNIGEVLKDYNRKSLFINTKLAIKPDEDKASILARARKCLERLKTDYIDCLMTHGCENSKMVKHKAFHAAAAQLKQEGRLRFVGISNHGPSYGQKAEESMEKVLLSAAADGRFDVMLLVYNFVQREMGERILAACAEKNIGATLMKTKPVDKYVMMQKHYAKKEKEEGKLSERSQQVLEYFKKEAEKADAFIKKHNLANPREIRDAAVRFAMGNPHASTTLINFGSFDDVESYLPLSGSTLTGEDKKKLALYLEGCSGFYCRHACGQCEPACPKGVPVNRIMRYSQYFSAQGREKHAMEKYAALATPNAAACENCPGHCQDACPYNVRVQGLLSAAHRDLSLWPA